MKWQSLCFVAALAVVGMTALPASAQYYQERGGHAHRQAPSAANDRMPFPALMNALFGRQRPATMPEPRFREPRQARPPAAGVVRRPPASLAARPAPTQPQPAPAPRRQMDPRFERQVVDYETRHPAGTIVVDTGTRFLYLVQDGGTALRYGVGVGREGFSWRGTERITRKAEWPDWRPPESMRRRQPELPKFMTGGPNNPLGARALYLGSTLYRIHGSNEPWTIGQAMSSGCIRMTNSDVIDLYDRVKVGAKVVVI